MRQTVLNTFAIAALVAAVASCSESPTTALSREQPPEVVSPYAGKWSSFTVGTTDYGSFTVNADGSFSVADIARGVMGPGNAFQGSVGTVASTPSDDVHQFTGMCETDNYCAGGTLVIGMQPTVLVAAVR